MIQDTPTEVKSIVGLGSFNYNQPNTHTPIITSNDYNNGYIKRYFVSNRNYLNCIETDAKGFQLADTKFYTKSSIDWKITGSEYNVYQGKTLQTTGVVDFNVERIKQASQYIKGIETVLNNPRQFWRGY